MAKNIMADIEFLQWASTSQETFHQNFELLEKKYENVEEPTLKVLVQAFLTTCGKSGLSPMSNIGMRLAILMLRETTKELKV